MTLVKRNGRSNIVPSIWDDFLTRDLFNWDNNFTSTGNSMPAEEKEGENYNRKEFSYQSFYRTFHLPKEVVNADKIRAKYENGLLRLEVPKRDEAKQKPVRFIDIQFKHIKAGCQKGPHES